MSIISYELTLKKHLEKLHKEYNRGKNATKLNNLQDKIKYLLVIMFLPVKDIKNNNTLGRYYKLLTNIDVELLIYLPSMFDNITINLENSSIYLLLDK